jgi:3-deoxy-D-manno-octulosonate 8-phosphate phosphatase (KDO 8-P phosphatase)
MHRAMPAEAVKLVICDVDGVLTDGRVLIDSLGHESKQFSVIDGTGIVYLQRSGLEVGFLSGRVSDAVTHRARELGVAIALNGVTDKRPALESILTQTGRRPSELCYVGDDLIDIPCLRLAGYPVAVANSHPEVKKVAEYVTAARGGEGAVREIAEVILKAQDRWETIMGRYR